MQQGNIKYKRRDEKVKKQGISLIVLVITIVIIIILSLSVILTITNNNPIENAKKAAFLNDMDIMKDELTLYTKNKVANSQGDYDVSSLNSDRYSLQENGEF